jgi:hypothetical protein
MRTKALYRTVLLSLLVLFTLSAAAQAQATRTWVSGVGDDVNPCSRTAPCKTFAGAISKTAAKGQINVLDPGAYGALTITKSITVDASGHFAGVLATLGSSGIIVNALSTDVVVLRGLTIDGNGTGSNGIRFLAGKALYVENTVIHNFGTNRGIEFVPTVASGNVAQLFVKDTIIRDNLANPNGIAVLADPGVGISARVELDNVRMERCHTGLKITDNVTAVARNSIASGHRTHGFHAVGPTSRMMLTDVMSFLNGTNGVLAEGNDAIIFLADSTITGNVTGIGVLAGGQIQSFGNNRIAGNTGSDGTPTAPGVAEQ